MTLLAVAVHGRGLVPPGEPVFTADDESLLRGSVAFETLRVYAGRPFLLDRHLERLAVSARELGLPEPDGAAELVGLLVAAGPADVVLRLYRSSEALVATAASLPPELDELRARGLALSVFEQEPSPFLAGVKTTSYAYAFAARRAAEAAGTDDALFVTAGRVLECAAANIWWATGDVLHTPAAGPGVLSGVTRSLLVELAGGVEDGHGLDDLLSADEAFTTSSIREVMPVTSIAGRPVGSGRPGPCAARLQAELRLRSLT